MTFDNSNHKWSIELELSNYFLNRILLRYNNITNKGLKTN